MFDFSDEESEPPAIRRRNPSPEALRKLSEELDIILESKQLSANENSFDKTQSIFNKNVNERSGPIVPMPNFLNKAFIVNEFSSGNKIFPSKLQNFDLGSKGEEDVVGTSISSCAVNSEDHPDSFFKSMQTIVFVAQIFAVMPISGTFGPNYKSLHFKWLHFKTLYWFLSLFGVSFCLFCSAIHGMDKSSFTLAASGITYFACGFLSSLLMLQLCRNWKKVNKEFAEVEFKLRKFGYPRKIGLKFKIFTALILVVALVEHLLAKCRSIEMAMECAGQKKGFLSLVELFFYNEYVEIFEFDDYSLWKAVLTLCAHFLTTANWNIKDLFLVLISWSIAERFKQIHGLMEKVHGKEKPISFWRKVREDYNTVSILTKKVDAHIQKLMLLSVGNNLFFICIQLLHSLKRKIASVKLLYFFWSFGFLVLRTSLVAFSAARINDESKEPKFVLYSVPQKNYSFEIRRFLTQLTTNEVSLTGGGFFSVTRSLILTITGTVITYEIVLVQFSGNEVEEDLISNKTICMQI